MSGGQIYEHGFDPEVDPLPSVHIETFRVNEEGFVVMQIKGDTEEADELVGRLYRDGWRYNLEKEVWIQP